MKDLLVLVDLDNKEIGYETKEQVHKEGYLHKAFSVFLYKGKEILLQKRNEEKYHSGGLWTNSCCSHPRCNESLEGAIQRRLNEELGIEAKVLVECLGEILYYQKFNDSVTEYERDAIYIGEYSGDIVYAIEEVSDVKWVDIDELKEDMVKNPDKYTCWFIIAFPMVVDYLNKKVYKNG